MQLPDSDSEIGGRPSSRHVGRQNVLGKALGLVMEKLKGIEASINASTFGRVFRLDGSEHPDEIKDASFFTEVRAGLTTFATMAYIIAVNADILSETGGPCECATPLAPGGLCANEVAWQACANVVKQDLITATEALAGLASILFGFFTNLPVALAPGMGLNAYFAYQVVGIRGTGSVPYSLALTAVFVEGFVFIVLALTGMRHWLVKIIPGTIKTASGVGIGLFLTMVGMSYSEGIGIITGNPSTPLTIAGCDAAYLDATTGACTGYLMTSSKMWLGIMCGGLLTSFLMAFRVKAAIVIGVALVSVLSWPRNTPFTYFPDTIEGDNRFNFFKKVVSFHPIIHTLNAQQWDLSGGSGASFALALFTFLYVDIIDCTATLYSMARFCGRAQQQRDRTKRVNSSSDGDFPRSTVAYCIDAVCISVGSLLGCSPVTAFIESGAGIAEGGRTGLTAVVTGLCFLVSLFFAPIFASIPPWATGCTLILVGCLMIRQVTAVNWSYIGDAIPSFVTIAFIPFSYSVAYGLIAGLFVYTALNSMIWIVMWLSRGTHEPRDYHRREYWTWKPAGEKPWIFRMFSKGRIWEDERRIGRRSQEPNAKETDQLKLYD
ncbi:inner membrane protein yieG [Coniella lustricola]|uniref:Inner membrane protein yieG n=1 Tax=Coniella lustricola TaxID=2025994 RepID=A0A2T3AG47_9PEZI|nr:inner membrane protein yieG [Coniella lustricola]